MELLRPSDVFADVLRRLPPRHLAVSRCVCKSWRAAVDDHRLLRADLLPLSVAGIFTLPQDPGPPAYFSRPSSSSLKINTKLDYMDTRGDDWWLVIWDHCNGLLLIDEFVLNPATRQCARVPEPPPLRCTPGTCPSCVYDYLVFDPTMSPHYEVLLVHSVLPGDVDPAAVASEWPPSPYVLRVFSSRTRQWEEKPFTREGDPAGSVAYMQTVLTDDKCYGACWQGSLYVHQHDFVMRITLSNSKYQIIKLPEGAVVISSNTSTMLVPNYYLGKSKKGVYCALVADCKFRLRVWFLDESCGKMQWVLKQDINLASLLANYAWKYSDDGPWTRRVINEETNDDRSTTKASVEDESEWDSDNGNISADLLDTSKKSFDGYISIRGFHPYKEVVFLHTSFRQRVVAYHWNTCRIQDLGHLYDDLIVVSFPFTPCRMGEL